MKKLLVLFICIVFVYTSFAESPKHSITVTIGASLSEGVSYRDDIYDLDIVLRSGIDSSVQVFFSRYFGIGTDFQESYGTDDQSGTVDITDQSGSTRTVDYSFDTSVYTASVAFLLLGRCSLGSVVDIYGGVGAAWVGAEYNEYNIHIDRYTYPNYSESDTIITPVAELGINIYIMENLVLGSKVRYLKAELEFFDDDTKIDVGGFSVGTYVGFAF